MDESNTEESRWQEASQYKTQPQRLLEAIIPSESDQPKPAGEWTREEIYDEMTARIKGDKPTGEWTVEGLRQIYDRMCCTKPYGSIDDFFAHVVSLLNVIEQPLTKSERTAWGQDLQEIRQLREQLAAEQKMKWELAAEKQRTVDWVREHSKDCPNCGSKIEK